MVQSTQEDNVRALALKHFPRPKPNPGQMEAIVSACLAILDGKKHVLIEAPTGSGKSLIATTVHKVMRELNASWRTTIITATKGLQNQYVEEEPIIIDLKAKGNYNCPIGAGPYNSGACRAKTRTGKCFAKSKCPYVKQRSIWTEVAQLRSTNFAFQVEACPSICMMPENKANLIIVDECHDIDEAIVEHTSIELNVEDFVGLKNLGHGKLVSMLADYINLFQDIRIGTTFQIDKELYDEMKALNDEVNATLDDLDERLKMSDSQFEQELLGGFIENLQQIQDKTQIFEACGQGKGIWILQAMGAGSVELKPVYSWQVAHHGLLRKAEFFIHMSATICGFEEYCGSLGINVDEAEIIKVPNSIPLESRKILVYPTQRVTGSFDVDKLTKNVDALITKHQKLKQNGIVHTVSFKLANDIYDRSVHKKSMIVSNDRLEIIDFLKENENVVVLSPSIEKGYDFKGDMSRYQIIPKVPWGYLGDPLVKLNSEIRPSWFARRAVLRIVQACGRSIRGVDDWATTYILDSSFIGLYDRNYELFPEWYVESLKFFEMKQ